jgi:hypothetical protein
MMPRKATFAFVMLTAAFFLTNFAPQVDFPVMKGPYFGQSPPGMEPELFAPAILSGEKPAFCSVFSPGGHEFYFVSSIEGEEHGGILCMKRVNDIWTRPEPAPFNSSQIENDVCLSPDGYRLFFRSWRPLPGRDAPEESSVIWFTTRTKSGWADPQPVECGGVPLRAGYPSVVNNGTLYFPHRSESNVGESDIHRSQFINGSYAAPENLGTTVNTKYIEGDLCVAPDESFLVVSCWNRPDNSGESDLYISFRRSDDTWTKLMNMGRVINSEHNENCPTISPDGKYFFFFRYDGKRSNTYWVSAKIIGKLRPEDLR